MSEESEPSGGEYEFAPRERAPAPQRGAPRREPAAPEPTPRPAEEAVSQPIAERLCPHCGFRVVGRAVKNRCPDCSGDLSALDDLLQFSSPAWTRGIANGFIILIPAVLLHCTAMTITWASDDKLVGAGLHLIGGVLDVAGTWVAGTREKRKNVSGIPGRLLMQAMAIGVLGVSIALAVVVANHLPAAVIPLIVWLHILLAGLGGMVGWYIRNLALRMPNDSLKWWSEAWMFLVPFVALAQIAFHVTGRAKAEFLMLFMCAIPMAGGFSAVALVACWILLRAWMELRTCATTAELIVSRRIQRQKVQEKKGR